MLQDAACYKFQVLDAVMRAAVQQARLLSRDLAGVLDKQRLEVRDFVAELMALL